MKTRKLLVALLILFCSAGAFPQNVKTLTNDDFFSWQGNGFYVSVDYNWMTSGEEKYSVTGVKAIFLKDHRYGLGLGFSSADRVSLTGREITSLNYVGPELACFIAPKKLVFPSLHLFPGLAYCRNCHNNDLLQWFVEPGLKLHLNVASFMRFSLNANYRYFQDKPGFSLQALNGLNFGFSVAYGKF
ncbi:MAG: hypothetical protein RBS73_10410 [Prolixibacteraceae bacterium]|jgi:hypothetical protein|nr:hypothetical protein [Prolixibacteraceae bacterium]